MLLMLWVCGAVVTVDQASKLLITSLLREGEVTSTALPGFRLLHLSNRRRGWGSPDVVGLRTGAWLVAVAAGIIVGSMLDATVTMVGVGAMIGGATGNLIDGLRGRGVTDFVDVRVWPVFNFADAAIVVGAVLTVYGVISFL